MENKNGVLPSASVEVKAKKSRKIILAAICIAVIILVSLAGIVYYLALPSQPPSVTSENIVTNFGDGVWANYIVKTYAENGTLVSTTTQNVSVMSGEYNGVACWLYVKNDTGIHENVTYSYLTTYYLDKSTFSNLHLKGESFADGKSNVVTEMNPDNPYFLDDLARFKRNMTVVARGESLTVQAGTFTVEKQQGAIFQYSLSRSFDVTQWVSTDVPAWGIVKYQALSNGILASEYELQSFGS